MNLLKVSWIFSRRRLIISFFLDYFILFLLLFFKKNIYYSYIDINKYNILIFCIIWTSLSYVFGAYVFKFNLFILDSIRYSIKNSCKLIISFIFLYLFNTLVLKIDFLSSRDNTFSIMCWNN